MNNHSLSANSVLAKSKQFVSWMETRTGGVYVPYNWRDSLFPKPPISVAVERVNGYLINDRYPSIFRLAPKVIALLSASAKVVGSGPQIDKKIENLKKEFQFKGFCISGGNWNCHIRRLEDHRTWGDVAHSLAYAKTAHISLIDAIWERGREDIASRYVDEATKRSTEDWSEKHALTYMQRIIDLAELAEKSGRMPSANELAAISGRQDGEIGIAISESGDLLHFRKGHHRMMLAKQLKIPSIEVAVHLVHAVWLRQKLQVTTRELMALVASDSGGHDRVREAIQQHISTFHN